MVVLRGVVSIIPSLQWSYLKSPCDGRGRHRCDVSGLVVAGDCRLSLVLHVAPPQNIQTWLRNQEREVAGIPLSLYPSLFVLLTASLSSNENKLLSNTEHTFTCRSKRSSVRALVVLQRVVIAINADQEKDSQIMVNPKFQGNVRFLYKSKVPYYRC